MTTRTRTTTRNPVQLLLALVATTALAIVLALASPAAAQFVDQDPSDSAAADQVDEQGTGEQEAAPVGGVDAGFGGAATGDGAGLGAPHAAALALLVLALIGHLANARRAAPVRD